MALTDTKLRLPLASKRFLTAALPIATSILSGQWYAAAMASRHQGKSEWEPARRAWEKAIARLRFTRSRQTDLLARYQLQLAMCEFFLGRLDEAEVHWGEAGTSGAVRLLAEYGLLQARLLRRRDVPQALDVLRAVLTKAPDNTAVLYEYCSASLDGPDPGAALPVAQRLVALGPRDTSFCVLASDVAERSGRWLLARQDLRRSLERLPGNVALYRRLVAISGLLGDLETARRDTVALKGIAPGELILWQQMLDLYEEAGKIQKARLICRFLARQWPHSRWHKLKYAELLAESGRLNEADRVLARLPPGTGEENGATDRTLWEVARRAGARHETLARLRHIRALGPVDLDSDIAFGYALADVEGPEVARQHFYALSIRTRFNRRVMHGLAHMAVRERDGPATLAAWRRASDIHPDDSYALREYCRALFESGEVGEATSLSRAGLDRFRSDRAYVEFFAWLSTATGAFAATLAFCRRELRRFPNAWQFLECGLICAAHVGQSSAFIDEATTHAFHVAYPDDIQRAYGVMRIASIERREDLLRSKFHLTGSATADHPWLTSLDADAKAVAAAPVAPVGTARPRLSEQLYRGSKYEAMVGRETLTAFRQMPGDAVDAILRQPGRGARPIYIFNKFEQARGGSELHALDLADRLKEYAKVELWAPTMCHHAFKSSGRVRVIDPTHGELPAPGGIVVLVGLYFDLGPYLKEIDPHRIIALYNTFEAPLSVGRIEAFHKTAGVPVELLYCSEMMGDELGLPGLFEPSPTDLDAFTPGSARPDTFVLGRHSRDVVEKHHPEDAKVYRAVSGLGGRSVILGGLSMRGTFGAIDGLHLLPATSKGIPTFLQSLSCYYYRTGTWVEPWGRVVIEALACGLPVVAHRLGGYAEAIRHGENGFLFEETDEAIDHIGRLARDPELRSAMGLKARASAEVIVGPAAMRRLVAFYLFEPPHGRQERDAAATALATR